MNDEVKDEYQKLIEAAAEQLAQHKQWLHAQLMLQGEFGCWIARLCGDVKLEVVKMDGKGGGSVSVVYAYPDELHAYLTSDRCPDHLKISRSGGVTVELAPTAKRIS